jgi:O-antigen ligase
MKIKLSYLFLLLSFLVLPLGTGFNMVTGFDFSKLFLIFVTLSFIFLIIKNFPKFDLKLRLLKYFYLLTIFIIVHSVIYYTIKCPDEILNAKYSNDPLIVNLVRLLLLSTFTFLVVEYYSKKFIISSTNLFNLGYTISFFGGFFIKPFLDAKANAMLAADGRFYGGFDNPNTFAATSMSLLVLNILTLVCIDKNYKYKFFNIIYIIFSIVGIFMSQSRSILLLSIILIFLITYKYLFKKIKLKYIFIATAMLFIFPFIIPKKSYEGLINRITTHTLLINDSKKGKVNESRILILDDYLRNIKKYFLIGTSYNREISVIENDYSTWKPFIPHNKYLSMLVQFGFIGFLLFIIFLLDIYFKFSNFKPINFGASRIIYFYYIIWILYFFVGQQNNSRDYYLMLGLVFGIINLNYKSIN